MCVSPVAAADMESLELVAAAAPGTVLNVSLALAVADSSVWGLLPAAPDPYSSWAYVVMPCTA